MVMAMKKTAIKGIIVSNDYQRIYDFFGVEATSPGKLQKDLEDAAGDEVNVEINSPGGYVNAGSELYTLLNSYKGNVTIDIVGQAASAASVAAMARHNRISPTASIMIHNVSVDGVSGDYHEMDKASNMLQALTKSVANAYAIKTGKARKDVLKLMDTETTMDADEAVKEGFVDEMIPDGSGAAVSILNANCQVIPQSIIDKVVEMDLVKHPAEGLDLANSKLKFLELEEI